MQVKKTTILVQDELMETVDFIGNALEISRNKIVVEALTQYVSANLETAKAIAVKKQELAKLMQEVK